jgi:NAD+--asparagine ADP-ribosyltransferase
MEDFERLVAAIGRLEAMTRANQEIMDAWLEEMKTWGKKKTTCQKAMKACLKKAKANPDKTMAGLKEMEVAVDVLEETFDKMDVADLEVNREKSKVVAVHQEIPNEEAEVETVGALETRNGDWRLAARLRGWQKKRT